LFNPLGISNYRWQSLPSGLIVAHGDIYITPRDMAKYGFLLLNKGKWQDNQIVSENWVNNSTVNHIQLPPLSWADGYGYLTWLKTYTADNITYESFSAEGWGGQKIAVFPAIDMVVVFTGANYVTYTPCDEIIQNVILPAIVH
jgi:CubicO group peptidase (beta-lactamase class C family)